ncbi:MAG: hypothetical protein ABL916_24950 [Burkholderiaceae bacterium]
MNTTRRFRLNPLLATVLGGAAFLSGCHEEVAPVLTPDSRAVEGTAAVGAALSLATVSITDTSGGAVCAQQAVVTSSTGHYFCTLIEGKTAPFLIVVTDPSGAYSPLVSVAARTPSLGTSLIANVSPLTNAIVGKLAPDGDALTVAATPKLVNVGTLDDITAKVVQQLAEVLAKLGAPAGYDPFSTPIVPATPTASGNPADQIIDVLKIAVVNGVTTISTIDNPDAAVALASATGAAPAVLPSPSTAAVTLADALKLLSASLNRCFALPVATRVLNRNDGIPATAGGREVTEVAAACEDITHRDFLHNGYRSGQAFYGLMNDAAMEGATFRAPEVMRYIEDSTAADHDRVVINTRYTDRFGTAGNIIAVAQKFPGSAGTTRATDWWVYGNQQPVDTGVRAFVRRNEQLAPNPGTAPFLNASASRFESGLEIFINKDGPGGTGLRAARVKGPGLPSAGLVYTRPNPALCTAQTWLNILRKDGNTDPAVAVPAPDNGNIFRLQRTVGVSGTDATAVRPNPNAGNGNNSAFPGWAHPLDYGQPVGNTDYIDFSALKANTTYEIELFYDGELTARHTVTKTLLTPVVPATGAVGLQWVALSAAARAYLDPLAAQASSTTSIDLSWIANPYAQTIASAGVYTYNSTGSVNQGLVSVVPGATTAVAPAPGNSGACASGDSFPALMGDGSSGRTLQLRYRMLDGGYKDSTTRFN